MAATETPYTKTAEHIWLQRLATAATVIAVPLAVMASGSVSATADAVDTCAPPAPLGGPMMTPPLGMMPPLRGIMPPPGAAPMPPFLRDIQLTDAQQDKLFALVHAQAPFERAKAREASKALDELQGLAASDHFDAEKARALADTHAQALAQLALMHAELGAKMRAILTPEQRKQLDDARVKAESHRIAFKRS